MYLIKYSCLFFCLFLVLFFAIGFSGFICLFSYVVYRERKNRKDDTVKNDPQLWSLDQDMGSGNGR